MYGSPYRGKRNSSAPPTVFVYTGVLLSVLGVAVYLFFTPIRFLSYVLFLGAAYSCVYAGVLRLTFVPRYEIAASLIRKLMIIALLIFLVSFILVETMIIAGSGTSADAADADYLIVLGAGVNGYTPSLSLSSRINATYRYLEQNPNTVAVLSGGQGPGESISEAQAMFNALVGKGIDPERLIKENRSASTVENLQFSFELIGQTEGSKISVLSNDYHLFRAGTVAKLMGVNVETVSAPTPRADLAIVYQIREYFALPATILDYLFNR